MKSLIFYAAVVAGLVAFYSLVEVLTKLPFSLTRTFAGAAAFMATDGIVRWWRS